MIHASHARRLVGAAVNQPLPEARALRQVDGEHRTKVEKLRCRRKSVLAASTNYLSLNFTYCVGLSVIFLELFFKTLRSKLFFYGSVARFTVRVVYPWQREQLPWKFGSSVVPRWTSQRFNAQKLEATFLTLTCASSSPGRFCEKLATFSLVVTGPPRGSRATPDNSEGSEEAGGAALLVVVVWIHASRRGFVLSRAENQSEPAAVFHLADDVLVNDNQPPTWT